MREQRAAQRYMLALPIVVRRVPMLREADLLYGKTRDISTRGLYFTTYEQLAPGMKFEFSLELPPEITPGSRVLVTAQANTARVESQQGSQFESVGVGAVIEKFQIIRVEPKPY